jgi:hypothetical protein
MRNKLLCRLVKLDGYNSPIWVVFEEWMVTWTRRRWKVDSQRQRWEGV